MSIASEIQTLQANKAAIKAAIEAKNPSVAPTDDMSNWPASIASIGRLVPETTGVTLVGSSVQLSSAGILSGFTIDSYATLPYRLPASSYSIDCVAKFKFNTLNGDAQGIWGNVGSTDGLTPFYLLGSPTVYLGPFVSKPSGTSWGVSPGEVRWSSSTVVTDVWIVLRLRYENGRYALERFSNNSWVTDATYSYTPPFSNSSLTPHLGNNRGSTWPLKGEIDLNYCYMLVNDRLLWEGVRSAYYNVKGLVS